MFTNTFQQINHTFVWICVRSLPRKTYCVLNQIIYKNTECDHISSFDLAFVVLGILWTYSLFLDGSGTVLLTSSAGGFSGELTNTSLLPIVSSCYCILINHVF